MEARYIQFPLSFMRNLRHDHKAVIENILNYGIYRFSTRIKYDINAVAKQVIYWNYRGGLSEPLEDLINSIQWEYVGADEDFNGFAGDTFQPDDEIEEMLLNFGQYEDLRKEAVHNYQFNQALSILKLEGGFGIYENGQHLSSQLLEGEPMPMININVLMDYYKNDKSDYEIEQLMAYIALKSILGKKPYFKTNHGHIRGRMFGYSTKKDIPQGVLKNPVFQKFLKRYHMDKVLTALKDSWYVKTYSKHTRGLWVGIGSNVSYEILIQACEKAKKKTKANQRKEEIRIAEATVRQQMNNNRSTAP